MRITKEMKLELNFGKYDWPNYACCYMCNLAVPTLYMDVLVNDTPQEKKICKDCCIKLLQED